MDSCALFCPSLVRIQLQVEEKNAALLLIGLSFRFGGDRVVPERLRAVLICKADSDRTNESVPARRTDQCKRRRWTGTRFRGDRKRPRFGFTE